MKKLISIFIFLIFIFNLNAQTDTLLSIRNIFAKEAQELKAILSKTQDAILIISMWDSCIIVLNQLDAYFSMLGIFNTIRKECVDPKAIDYLSDWLLGIKIANLSNIKNLTNINQKVEFSTQSHIDKLKSYYDRLNKCIDIELNKLSLLKSVYK